MAASPEEVVKVELTRDEALWLKSAARRGAEDSIVPGATDALYKLAKKIGRAITHSDMRDGIIRKLAKAEMVKRRGYA